MAKPFLDLTDSPLRAAFAVHSKKLKKIAKKKALRSDDWTIVKTGAARCKFRNAVIAARKTTAVADTLRTAITEEVESLI